MTSQAAYNSTANSSADIPLDVANVDWQTVYFIFIALAACTVTQPCGRVLGFNKRWSPFLRISPLVCIADAAMILLYPLLGCIWVFRPTSEFIVDLLQERFPFDEDDEIGLSPEHARAERTGRFFRLIWFVLGAVPPLIKLMAMRGIPGCQTVGLMFSISFIVVELLLSCRQHFAVPKMSKYIHYKAHDTSLLTLVCLTMLVTISVIWLQSIVILDRLIFSSEAHSTFQVLSHLVHTFYIFFTCIIMIGLVIFIGFRIRDTYLRPKIWWYWTLETCFVGAMVALPWAAGTSNIWNFYKSSKEAFPSLWYFLLSLPLPFGTALFICTAQVLKNYWNRTILKRQWGKLNSPASTLSWEEFQTIMVPEERQSFDSSIAWIFLLCHILGPLLWFAYVFDASDTSNPSWTKIFG